MTEIQGEGGTSVPLVELLGGGVLSSSFLRAERRGKPTPRGDGAGADMATKSKKCFYFWKVSERYENLILVLTVTIYLNVMSYIQQ